MSSCQKCGLEIAFKKLASGKSCPTNPDGSDHWDICRATQFLNANKKIKVGELTYKTVPTGNGPYLEDDGRAPWDETIVYDWSWVRGSKTIAVKGYRKYVDPKQFIAGLK